MKKPGLISIRWMAGKGLMVSWIVMRRKKSGIKTQQGLSATFLITRLKMIDQNIASIGRGKSKTYQKS